MFVWPVHPGCPSPSEFYDHAVKTECSAGVTHLGAAARTQGEALGTAKPERQVSQVLPEKPSSPKAAINQVGLQFTVG